MTANWYALRSQPRKEDVVWQQVRAQKCEAYYPRVRVRTVNPRARQVRPYFPGYLFVKADLEALGLSTFQYMPHAVGLVCFGGEPAQVPESLVRAIQQRVGEITAAGGEFYDGLRPGDRVSIQGGPFAGYEAIFEARLSGGERVRVLLDLLQGRRVPVEMSAALVERKKRS
jgi:transcriptional antiterminator RfaH